MYCISQYSACKILHHPKTFTITCEARSTGNGMCYGQQEGRLVTCHWRLVVTCTCVTGTSDCDDRDRVLKPWKLLSSRKIR